MTRPISNPPHVAARRRRRQGSSSLFRTALALALVFTGGLALLTARSLVPKITALDQDLADYLRTYNFDRAHSGRLTKGRVPADIVFGARKTRTVR